MGWFVGHPWKIWVEWRLKGAITLGDGDLIWPIKATRNQRVIHVGERKPNEPALITCQGRCSSAGDTWTWHRCVRGASYECRACGKVRRWGLDVW